MKSLSRVIFAVAGVIVLAVGAPAYAASTNAGGTVEIVTPLAIVKTIDLSFGKVASSAALGTVKVTAAGVRSMTGGVTLITLPAPAAASFNVTGANNSTYTVTLPAAVTLTSGANTMTVNAFTSTPTPTGTLSAAGAQTLTVGGTLNVAANQVAGTYTGTFAVTVVYN